MTVRKIGRSPWQKDVHDLRIRLVEGKKNLGFPSRLNQAVELTD